MQKIIYPKFRARKNVGTDAGYIDITIILCYNNNHDDNDTHSVKLHGYFSSHLMVLLRNFLYTHLFKTIKLIKSNPVYIANLLNVHGIVF